MADIPAATNTDDLVTRLQQLTQETANIAAELGTTVNDAANTHADFFLSSGLSVFVLACFVGYYVVWRVTPALHSPLMGITNAISSVIIVGAIIAAGTADMNSSRLMGFFAVILASINIFGGFIVTHRMLQMFKKKPAAQPAPQKDAA